MKVAYAALFVLLLGVVGVTKAMAQDFSVGNLNYTINEDGTTVTLTGHVDGTNATGNLVIPSSVTYYGSAYAVTAIANSAFKDCNSLTGSLVIPNSMITIGEAAFRGCSGFTGSLTLSGNVTSIGHLAFYDCGFTGILTIPESVSWIGGRAFYSNNFTTLNFNAVNCDTYSDYLEYYYYNEYYNYIYEEYYDEENDTWIETGHWEGDWDWYYGYVTVFEGLPMITTLHIGNAVQRIPDNCFRYFTGVTGNLVIPNSVNYIGGGAFMGCTGYTGSLNIPNAVTYIGGNAFNGCTGFTGSLNIPNAVTYIGGGAFNGCTGFTGSLNIPNAVTYIGGGAFNGCTGLSGSLTIGESVREIWENAFANTGFTALNFNAKNCTAFNSSWLSGVTSLHSLNIGENVQRIPDGFLSDFSSITGSLTIPNAVTYIGANALTLGLSLTEIGSSAFFGACAGFTSFVVRAQVPPTTGSNVFSSAPANIPVYVPCGTFNDYQEASTWGSFVNLQETNPCQWTITASTSSMGCGTVSGAGTYIQGQTCTLTATPVGAFEFVNWTEDGQVVSTNRTYSFTVVSDRHLVANFVLETLSDDFNDGVVNQSLWITEGNVTATGGNINLVCSGWDDNYVSSSLMTTPLSMPDNGQILIERRFIHQSGDSRINYILNLNNGSSTSISILYEGGSIVLYYFSDYDEYSYRICSEVYNTWMNEKLILDLNSGCLKYYRDDVFATLPIPQFAGLQVNTYQVEFRGNFDWSDVINFSMDYVKINDESSYLVVVQVNPSQGGTVTGAGSYQPGQTCTLIATPNEYYEFVNWTDENGQVVSTNPTYSFTVTGNRPLVANFEIPGCDVILTMVTTADPYYDENYPRLSITNDYGLNEMIYLEYGTHTYTLHIAEGSHVVMQWYGSTYYYLYYTVKFENGYPIYDSYQSGSLSYEFDMNCDDAFNPVTISAVPNAEGRGTVSGGGGYPIGETCTLTATANAGHSFVRWMENGQEVSTEPTYTFTVNGPRNLVAAFTAPTDEIIVFADPNVENRCVMYWDTDGDGYMSYDEAASVAYLSNRFRGRDIISFDELQYFTGLTGLEDREFNNCGNLTSVILPESLNYIGEEAFLNCGSLRGAITLPESLLEVYGNAFASCDELTTINYNAINCTMMGNAQKPVFYDCVSLEHINIGANVQNIPNYAFKRCSTVTDITVAAVTPPTIGPNTFGTVSRSIPVFVPVGSGEAYRTAPYWEEFFNIIEGSGPTSNHYHCNMHQFSHNMSLVGVVQINGVEQSNDFLEVGAFCGDECRGSQLLTTYPALNRSMVFLTLFGESGDLISFRLYDHNTGEESMLGCTTVIPFEADGIVGSYNAPQILNFIPMQNTALETGWTWFSTYIDQTGINGLLMMEESLGENGVMIKSHTDGFVMYDESGWTGTLEAIHPESMYMVNTNAPAMLSVTGSFTDPAQHPVTLYTGWNWVGYPSISVASLNNALSGFNAQDGDVIKSHGLFSQYVNGIGWTGALQMLKPGMGFMYHSLNGGVTQLTYSVSAKDDISVFNGTNEVCHWVANVNAYPYNMSVVAVVELEGMEARDSRYELAAFAGNECRGSARLMYVEALDRYLAFLTVVGIGQAELRWALYDTETGEVGYNTETLRFEQDAILGAVKDPLKVSFAKFNATDDTFVNDLIVYPNPVRRNQMVRISLPAHGEVTVEIVDALGNVLTSERVKGETFEIKAPDTAGVYAVKVTVDGKGVSCSKMIVR